MSTTTALAAASDGAVVQTPTVSSPDVGNDIIVIPCHPPVPGLSRGE